MTTVKSNDGTTIAFERSGDGPAAILVGGALSTRSSEAQVAAQLAPRLSVITYDRRGRDDSGDSTPYAVTQSPGMRSRRDPPAGTAHPRPHHFH